MSIKKHGTESQKPTKRIDRSANERSMKNPGGVVVLKTLLEEQKIEETIRRIPRNSFTVLDFIQVFQELYAKDWKRLKMRFGQFGEKRRYTVNTYLSNRLDLYSQKSHSLLRPFTRYSQGKFRDRRRTTKEEQEHFGSPWISVFKKRKAGLDKTRSMNKG